MYTTLKEKNMKESRMRILTFYGSCRQLLNLRASSDEAKINVHEALRHK
jgi:hypothetical protein